MRHGVIFRTAEAGRALARLSTWRQGEPGDAVWFGAGGQDDAGLPKGHGRPECHARGMTRQAAQGPAGPWWSELPECAGWPQALWKVSES